MHLKNKDSYEEVKAKILDVDYNKNNNLFKIRFKDLDKEKEVVMAIKGTDWGVTPDIPEDIIDNFCKEMIGKKKNLHISVEKNSSLRDAKKDKDGTVTQEEIDRIATNVDNFPVDEVMNTLHEEPEDNES